MPLFTAGVSDPITLGSGATLAKLSTTGSAFGGPQLELGTSKIHHRDGDSFNVESVNSQQFTVGGTISMRVRSTDVYFDNPPVLASATGPQWAAAGAQQTTVGVAGTAAALPTAPTKYLRVRDSAGTVLVIPAYNA